MLIGECTFDAESMNELREKIEKGNYTLPASLSKEIVSFLNGMLQFDLKKRLSAEELLYHKFLTTPYSQLTRINIKRSKMVLNTKGQMTQSIMGILEADNPNINLGNIDPDMIDREKIKNNKRDKTVIDKIIEIDETEKTEGKIDDETIKKYFYDGFFNMNDDFIYIEPKLIPIIPGDDPSVINKVSEFAEDNF